MKCSRCGARTNSLPAMGAHVRKAHPGAMRRTPRHAKLPATRTTRADHGTDSAGTWHPVGCRCGGCRT